MKKYGGVNNQKSIYEIQEARIISAPGMSKITKKQSKFSVFFGWLVYLVISYVFTDLLLIAIIDVGDRIKLPIWVIFILPATPFILTLLIKVFSALGSKKHTNQED